MKNEKRIKVQTQGNININRAGREEDKEDKDVFRYKKKTSIVFIVCIVSFPPKWKDY